MMLRHLLLVGALVGLTGAAGIAAAPKTGPICDMGRRPLASTPLGRFVSGQIGRLMVLRSDLDLSDEQRGQIRDVLVSRRAQIVDTVKSVREKRLALRDAVLDTDASESDIRTAADQLGDAIADAAVKAAKLRGELAPILTDEQRQTVAGFIAERDDSVTNFLEKAGKGK